MKLQEQIEDCKTIQELKSKHVHEFVTKRDNKQKQESIPVGCKPPACPLYMLQNP